MKHVLVILLSLCVLVSTGLVAQPAETKPEAKKALTAPQNMKQATETFGIAWNFANEQQYKEALDAYRLALEFFEKDKSTQQYVVDVLNNVGAIHAMLGDTKAANASYRRAIQVATELGDFESVSEFYHKLGIIYKQMATRADVKKREKEYIYPDENSRAQDMGGLVMSRGTYTRLMKVGKNFEASRIEMKGSRNPFQVRRELYSKLFNLKIRDEFDPDTLITPDSVELLVQVRKKGYFGISAVRTFDPELEYDELNETMITIPRKVKPEITEDFYRQGLIAPDEITLTQVIGDKVTGKPVKVTDKEPFKPGRYQLTIKKAGYNPLQEEVTIYPGEGSFILRRELKSKTRNIAYRIQSDFSLESSSLEPDEITMNGQVVNKNSKVKPGEYKLVIRKEGYEPVVKTVVAEPEERPYIINEFMRALPREVVFDITSDYSGEKLTPDEITFNSRPIKYGDSVRPDAYRIIVRKKGYNDIIKNAIVYPKSEPFVLKETMKSLPRSIRVNLSASFPKNARIFNYECTLNGKNAVDAFKPGEYELYIKAPGYKPMTKKVNISPSDLPFEIKEILNPKERVTNLALTRDVPPENPDSKPKITLINENDSQLIQLKDGDKVKPENYLFKVDQPGYDPYVAKQLILPSEDPHQIKLRLNASLRGVIAQITAEYPAQQTIIPDEITINNKPLNKDFKLKPGVHDLVILKEGYLPIRKPIRVLASPKEFFLVEQMETRSRLVSFEFLDSFDRRPLSPNNVTLDGETIAPNAPQNLKPGEYELKSSMRGYASLEETISIPVGSGEFKITRFMRAIKRDIIVDITSDYRSDERLIPDILTLGDTRIASKATVTPGIFNLVIQKAGYYPILKRITINPDPKPYVIKEQMISKPRQLKLNISSSFNQEELVTDEFIIGTQNVKDGEEIKPGNYAVVIKKKGYQTFSDQIEIEPSEKPYVIDRQLEALPRLVKYEVVDEQDVTITPDVINLNDKILDQRTAFLPGKYNVNIEKLGFEPKSFEILIEPGDEPYIIRARMVSLPREIELLVNGEFPPEPIDPEVAAFNGRDVRDDVFKPGTYELEIQSSGFESIKETVVVPPGEEPFLLERTLMVKPRTIAEEIEYDVMPPEHLQPYKISVAPADNPKNTRVVAAGDKIKPGIYNIRIEKEAYEVFETKKYVWPMESKFTINEMLIAKQVEVYIDISYDVEPPADLSDYTCSLIDINTGIARVVQHGKRVKPGNYYLTIQRPGYDFGARKEITILPSEEPYQVSERLLAKPRKLSFDMVFNGILIPAYEIINKATNAKVDFNQEFPAGKVVSLRVKFRKYATVSSDFMVVPGEGPFVASVPLTKLKSYEFQSRKDEMVIDGIKYPLAMYADGELIEEHLVKKEKGLGRFIWTVQVAPKRKNLQVFAGYKYIQKPFQFIGMISRLSRISIPKLIEHLNRVANKDQRGQRASLIILEKMLRSFSEKRELRKAHARELESLVQYVDSWKFDNGGGPQERMRKKTVIEQIRKLIK